MEGIKNTDNLLRCPSMRKRRLPAKSEFVTGKHGLHVADVQPGTLASSSTADQDLSQSTPLVTPIYHSSTYAVKQCSDFGELLKDGFVYTRLGCPTTRAVEAAITDLEGGEGCVVFSSGMAAITSCLMSILKPGDHVLSCNPVYSGTHKFFSKFLPNYNISVTFVTIDCLVDDCKAFLQENTKIIYAETPCNPTMAVIDLEKLGQLGQQHDDVVTVVDGTFGSPYLQQPLKYGIDVSIHSCTKYLGGHSDLLAGCVTAGSLQLYQKIREYAETFGAVQSAFDSSLLHRGLKTLHIRMDRHCSNALHLAQYLEAHPKIDKVYYCGLPSHPDHELAKRQMRAFGGMISFTLKGGFIAAKEVVESLRLIHLAVSLGGVESLIEHVPSMTHGPWVMSEEDLATAGLDPSLVRLSVGLEDVLDLENDLRQALDKVTC